MPKITKSIKVSALISLVILALSVCALVIKPATASAALPGTSPNPQNGAVGLEGTITEPPPSIAPTISIPTNGQTFTTQPVTVSGICTTGLLIRLFSNDVFIGSAECSGSSYSITASLFDGQNQLTTQGYDALGQSSPVSNQGTVNFNSPTSNSSPQLQLTSSYAERGASPGTTLSWPIDISGGSAPFAISIDWGDGTSADLISESAAGSFTAQHTYSKSGVYNVLIKATDQNGSVSYLQLVGVGNGKIIAANSTITPTTTKKSPNILWWPMALAIPLIILAFWLGGRHKLIALRRKMEQSSERVQ